MHVPNPTPAPVAPARRLGRRPGKPDTRQEIVTAAYGLFCGLGYDATSLRAVARKAEVDAALVHHYFADKRALFLATAQLAFDPAPVIRRVAGAGRQQIGTRLVSTALQAWDSPWGKAMIEAVRHRVELVPALLGFMKGPITDAVQLELGMPRREAELRTGLVEAQVSGLAQVRYLARLEPLASMPRETVVAVYGPILDHLLLGELPTGHGMSSGRPRGTPSGP